MRLKLGTLALSLFLSACGGGGDASGGSAGGGGGGGSGGGGGGGATALSHNAGTDCIACHRSGGSAASKGIFTVAGTVYRNDGSAQANSTVNLYPAGSGSGAAAQATLVTDALGNFYTTQTVASLVPASGQQFAQGANVVVRVTGGTSRSMPGVITNGSCNACHSPGGGVGRVTAQLADGAPSVSASAASNGGESFFDAQGLVAEAVQIATGAAHACAVKADGGVSCWGSNSKGQLGNSAAADLAAPVAVAALGQVSAAMGDASIAAGDNHTCVIAAMGHAVSCWGANDKGQLGNGTMEPATVSAFSLPGVTALSAAGDSTCARVGEGEQAEFYCWGLAPRRVDVSGNNVPEAIWPLLGKVTSDAVAAAGVAGRESTSFLHVASVAGHSCGITTRKRIKCWEGAGASVDIPLQ